METSYWFLGFLRSQILIIVSERQRCQNWMQPHASKYDRTENSPTNKAAHRSSMWHCGHVTCCNLHSKIKIIIERRNTLTTASRPQLRGRLMWSMVFVFVLLYCVTKYGREILIIMVHIDFGPAQVEHLDYGIKALVMGQGDVVHGVRICIAVQCNEIWTLDINNHGTH